MINEASWDNVYLMLVEVANKLCVAERHDFDPILPRSVVYATRLYFFPLVLVCTNPFNPFHTIQTSYKVK